MMHLRIACLLVGVAHALALRGRMESEAPADDYPAYEEKFFDQTLDHFRYHSPEPPTWKQRYLMNSDNWNGQGKLANGCKGPWLFYVGNEGPIDGFWAGSGFVVKDLAQKLGAMVVFGEERYYGKSLPFGAKSLTDKENVQYLTIEQVLADYANLLASLLTEHNATNCPVIAFGGSFGGTLTTFFRLKYPHIIAGGLAASAPFGYYDPEHWAAHNVTQYTWIDIVNKDYREAGCLDDVIATRKLLDNMGKTEEGRAQLQKALNLCNPPRNARDATYIFTDTIETLPQMDYSYQIGVTPGNPVNATCKAFADAKKMMQMMFTLRGAAASDDAALLSAAAKTLTYYYPLKDGKCIDAVGQGGVPGGGPAPADAWGYQSCTETFHEFAGRGVRDYEFDLDKDIALCTKYFGAAPKPYIQRTQFGGYRVNAPSSPLTNVIFSNGLRDPWSGGGMLEQTSPSRPVFIMPNGAHHSDLRAEDPRDPLDVVEVRLQETAIIQSWIREASLPGRGKF